MRKAKKFIFWMLKIWKRRDAIISSGWKSRGKKGRKYTILMTLWLYRSMFRSLTRLFRWKIKVINFRLRKITNETFRLLLKIVSTKCDGKVFFYSFLRSRWSDRIETRVTHFSIRNCFDHRQWHCQFQHIHRYNWSQFDEIIQSQSMAIAFICRCLF